MHYWGILRIFVLEFGYLRRFETVGILMSSFSASKTDSSVL